MKLIPGVSIAAVTVFLLIQFVPYGRDHKNPPVLGEPAWNSPGLRGVVKKACFNCHSNETTWPFYASIAPASWLVYYDVAAARKKLNFSEWQGGKREGEDSAAVAHQVSKGKMPPFRYVIAHPEARLSADEKKALIEGVQLSFKPSAK